jgi:hypothetical protein
MDVVYKGGSLLATQAWCGAQMALQLPHFLLASTLSSICQLRSSDKQPQPQAGKQQQEQHSHGQATYLEGKVLHSRRRPVDNSFECVRGCAGGALHVGVLQLPAHARCRDMRARARHTSIPGMTCAWCWWT